MRRSQRGEIGAAVAMLFAVLLLGLAVVGGVTLFLGQIAGAA